jgi:mannosyltransferase
VCAAVRDRATELDADRARGQLPGQRRERVNAFRAGVLRTFGPLAAVGALCGFLIYRLQPDVGGKPYYEDEAVAGLIAVRPLDEVLDTVLLDRGGAPLHFVLAHVAFWFDTSADALRWLSVVAAVAAIPLCFDLARRLGGPGAGVIAAAVAASSTALAVYGSFGRMYALFVFVAALFADLFVRALRLRTRGALAAAAAAGWLLPAVHPYGAVPAAVALVAALAIWSGRPWRAAWPVVVAVLAAVPLLLADLRLADRAGVGAKGESLASPGGAWGELVAAVSSFAGGDGLPLVFFAALAAIGVARLIRVEPAVAALTLSTAVPPLLFLAVRTGSPPDLSPRHLFYGLPLWAAAIGVGASRLTRQHLVLGLIAATALVSPRSALHDPRSIGFATASPEDVPAVRAGRHDLLLPYSAAFLDRLPNVRDALALPHGPGTEVVSALDHAGARIEAVHIAVPTQPWTLLRVEGPFSKREALEATAKRLHRFEHPSSLDEWFRWIEPGLCEALRKLDRGCP